MKKITAMTTLLLVLLALLLAGCDADEPDHPTDLTAITNGKQFMSLGNSLTAGFLDGALIGSGQAYSFPLLIARQMGLDVTPGTGDFTQPYIDVPGIGDLNDAGTHATGVLFYDTTTGGLSVLGETPLNTVTNLLQFLTQPEPYENLGVPGALLTDVMNAYSMATSVGAAAGSPNPFFDFINRAALFGDLDADLGPAGEDPSLQPTMLRAGIARGARVATLWIGNNDILGGATQGTPVVGVTVTDPTAFANQYITTLMTLAGGLVQRNGFPSYIVVANIPSITDIPYFMPKAAFEAAFDAVSPAPWSVIGSYAEGDDDDGMLVCFPALADAGGYVGGGAPLPGNYTLTSTEVGTVATVVDSYNQAIASAVAMVNASYPGTCALWNANETFSLLKQNDPLKTTHFLFLVGDMGVDAAAAATYFSLDGVHPNSRGYAFVADHFLTEINDLMGADYPLIGEYGAIPWNPTYGQGGKSVGDGPLVSSEAGEVLRNMFH